MIFTNQTGKLRQILKRLSNQYILFGKLLYFFTLSIIPYSAFYLIYFLQKWVWGGIFDIRAIFSGFFIAAVFLYFLFWSNIKVTKFIQDNIIDYGLNLDKIKDQLLNEISKELELTNILNSISNALLKVLQPSQLKLMVVDNKGKAIFFENKQMSLMANDNVMAELKSVLEGIDYPGVMIVSKLKHQFTPEMLIDQKYVAVGQVLKIMEDNKIAAILPQKESGKIVLCLLLGAKQDGFNFSEREVDFIEAVISNGKVAIDRALLHQQVQDSAMNLKIEVDHATADLKAKNIALEDTLRKERDMLDILGHELRTPLTIAKNSALMLKKMHSNNTLTHDSFDKYVYMAEENLVRESKLLETLLSTTKIDNNRLELEFVKVDFIDVVNDSLDGLLAKAKKKKLAVYFAKPEKCYVITDRNRIQEVVDNLIDNAIKYTHKGSVTITLGVTGNEAKLEIQDTGIGISEDELHKIGQKFYRTNTYLESSKSHGYDIVRPGGTGLGLYVTFTLVKRMGGRVIVTSELGHGSKFVIMLPLFNEEKDTSKSLESKSSPRMTVFERFNKMKEAKLKADNSSSHQQIPE